MSKTPMSDTQEKLKHLIANLVVDAQYEISNYEAGGCSYKEYSRRIEKVSNTAEQEALALIESAKREELEALKKESYVCTCASGGAGCDDAVFVDDIDNRIAQLKQSEESE